MKDGSNIHENRWLWLIFAAGLSLLGIALVFFFGELLKRLQPFFSIALAIIALIWVRSYYSRAFKFRSSKTNRSHFNYLLQQGLIASGLLLASIVLLFLRNVTLYWPALSFLLAGLGLMLLGGILVWPHVRRELASVEISEESGEVEQDEGQRQVKSQD